MGSRRRRAVGRRRRSERGRKVQRLRRLRDSVGEESSVNSSAERSSNRRPARRGRREPHGDLVEFGRVDPPGDVGQVVGLTSPSRCPRRSSSDSSRSMVSSISAWVSADPPTRRHCSPVLRRCWLSRPSRPNPMIAALSRAVRRRVASSSSSRGGPFASGVPVERRGERPGSRLPAAAPSPRDSYRLPDPRSNSAAGGRFAAARRGLTGNLLTTRSGIPWRSSAPPCRPP